MLHIVSAEYLENYRVRIHFNDGETGVVDFAESLDGTVFLQLRDLAFFQTFRIEGHTLSWSNGADFAPEYIRQLVQTQNHIEIPLNLT